MSRQQWNRIAFGAQINCFAQDPCQVAKTDCYGLKNYLITPFTAQSHRQQRVSVSAESAWQFCLDRPDFNGDRFVLFAHKDGKRSMCVVCK